ncbi:Endoribonuclease L-PSP/chorismate mutase-like protein [Pseudomassariella vexata]|uniref:Endoribonuclease L-PSP/chorismate mutase-like protein n=1 Tax=Pseudomassariella vexata TaxID=1141098 RepID=A0A1Y2DI16_9PEZI|nr:Endoribonuclease L-PSP/chorismate mutase-like protein [Pseudomassariella vexata]ORY58877.1 Endoribonuclease L-PSP/chorismate mutase-like protein [Pseudomassariella vexata]
MAPISAVWTSKSPKPLPQFSQAVKFNGMVYCSGNIGLDPATSKLVDGGVKEQTRQALKNLSAVLAEAGSGISNVIKVNVFLTTMDNFAAMNEAYDEFFNTETKPCRTCVAVYQLPFGALVEIECTGFLNPTAKI